MIKRWYSVLRISQLSFTNSVLFLEWTVLDGGHFNYPVWKWCYIYISTYNPRIVIISISVLKLILKLRLFIWLNMIEWFLYWIWNQSSDNDWSGNDSLAIGLHCHDRGKKSAVSLVLQQENANWVKFTKSLTIPVHFEKNILSQYPKLR